MCGINLTTTAAQAGMMNEALRHRGVRSNITKLGDLHLGHVRLPIQGLDPAHDHPQKVNDLTGAFVGEIFNYKDFDASAKSDLPVLLGKLSEEGTEGLKDLDGFWAIIYFDEHRERFHITTDLLAKKPLYYRQEPFGVSSEISPLVALDTVTPNRLYFSTVAKWGYCPWDLTPFNEIVKIPAGFEITLDKTGDMISAHTYDELVPTPNNIAGCLEEAVKNRLVSDVPVSILMSGGLDSTIVYCLTRIYQDKINVFHIENDEAEFLDYIAFQPGDKVTALTLPDEMLFPELELILLANDGPVDLGSVIPQYLLAREIKNQGFNVCLGGDGADELFGGYRRAKEYDSQYSDIFHELIYYHLPRLDKMMMAHTVELRSPFLSRKVIEAAMATPRKDRTDKKILKDLFKEYVPKEIIERKKKPLRYKHSQEWRMELIRKYKKLIWEK